MLKFSPRSGSISRFLFQLSACQALLFSIHFDSSRLKRHQLPLEIILAARGRAVFLLTLQGRGAERVARRGPQGQHLAARPWHCAGAGAFSSLATARHWFSSRDKPAVSLQSINLVFSYCICSVKNKNSESAPKAVANVLG